jgi:TolA-binding protein
MAPPGQSGEVPPISLSSGPTPMLVPSSPPPLPQPPPAPAPPRARAPDVAMQEGNAALARRDYAAAESAAREVLASKASPRSYDGQLLLAQALFGQRQYSNAAIAFDDTYTRARKGAHAQDALLGLANSLTAINEKKAACGTLDKLHAEFPQPRPDLRDGIAVAGQHAGCR